MRFGEVGSQGNTAAVTLKYKTLDQSFVFSPEQKAGSKYMHAARKRRYEVRLLLVLTLNFALVSVGYVYKPIIEWTKSAQSVNGAVIVVMFPCKMWEIKKPQASRLEKKMSEKCHFRCWFRNMASANTGKQLSTVILSMCLTVSSCVLS